MRNGLLTLTIGAALLGGCGSYGRQGLASPGRYPGWPCDGLDAERGRVETAASRLFDRAKSKGAFGQRAEAELRDTWPMLIFTRERGSGDRQRYEQLSISYEQLRIAARQKGCALAFAPNVSRSVRMAAGAD